MRRPQLKNRSFDEIVPKDKVWRTGANEATELRLFNDIEINNTTSLLELIRFLQFQKVKKLLLLLIKQLIYGELSLQI